MKKLTGIIFVLVMLCAFSISAFAGNIHDEIAYDDNYIMFIGEVIDCEKNREEPKHIEYKSVTVKVAERIKGDAIVGETIEQKGSLIMINKIKKGDYYLFLANKNSVKNYFYIWGIEKKEGNHIELYNPEDVFTARRMEEFINDGTYAKAEIERVAKLSDEEKSALGKNSVVEIERKPDTNYGFLVPVAAAVVISLVAVIIALKKKKQE